VLLVFAVVAGVVIAIFLGRVCIGIGYFSYAVVDYSHKEAALEKRVAAFTEADYVALVEAVEQLTSTRQLPKDSNAAPQDEDNGTTIPASLAYLQPQRVWISEDTAQIELLHMMDADTTIYVVRGEDGIWSVSGHFGDYMNKPRVLWTQRKPESIRRPGGRGSETAFGTP
jgi:hypothetical protein